MQKTDNVESLLLGYTIAKLNFSQKVTANKHQFSPLYTVCKRLWVLLNKMCFCLRLYGKRDRLPINYFTGLTCSFNSFVQGKF